MIIFETDRLIIRSIQPADIEVFLQIYNKSENMHFISRGKSKWNRNEIIEKFQKLNKRSEKGIGIYAVELKLTETVIGEVGLFNSFNSLKKIEIGYIIDSNYWKQGFATEICTGLIDFAFKELKVKSLIARMYCKNINSVKVSEKCGMKKIHVGLAENGEQFFVFERAKE